MPKAKKKQRRRKKATPGKTLQEMRRDHVQKLLDEHLAKLQREAKLVQKWSRKVAYYDKEIDRKHAEEDTRRRNTFRKNFPPRKPTLG